MRPRNKMHSRFQDTLKPVWMKFFLLENLGLGCFLEKKMLRYNTFSSKIDILSIMYTVTC